MSQITVTLDDQVNGERIQVNLDSALPVGQVIDALVQLRRLPSGSRDDPIRYDLIRMYNDEVLRAEYSLAAQGVQPGEELILTERDNGLDERSKLLLALGALGTLAVLCVAGILLFTVFRAANNTSGEATLTPDTTLTAIAVGATEGTPPATQEGNTDGDGNDGTPQPTVDSANPTPTDTGDVDDADRGCNDNLVYVADITIPDKSEILPGESFVKTWRVQNNGTCDWGSDYLFLYVDGAQMSGPNGQILGETVPAGRQIDISVNLRAPDDPGTYQGFWQMQNADGDRFGDVVFVEIVVPEPTPTPTLTPTPIPETDVTLVIDPETTVGPFDLVSITATTADEVPVIGIVAADDEGNTLDNFTCEETDTCEVEFGGNENTYAGEVTVTAYACAAVANCANDNLGSATGTFTIVADIGAPSQLVVDEDDLSFSAGTLTVAEILWGSVTDVEEYVYGYILDGGDPVEVGTTDATTNTASFEIEGIGASDFPITIWVQACNTFGCSDRTEEVIDLP